MANNKDLHIVTTKQLEQAKAAHAKLLTAHTEFGELIRGFDNHATPVAPKVRKPRTPKVAPGETIPGTDAPTVDNEIANDPVEPTPAPAAPVVVPIKAPKAAATPKAAPTKAAALPKRPGPAMPKRATR